MTPEPNANGWNRSDVTISLAATDDIVGTREIHASVARRDGSVPDVAYIDPGAEVTLPPLTAEGIYDVTYYAVDLLGNAESPKTLQIRIDRTGPTITIAEPPLGPYVLNESAEAAYACTDEGGSRARLLRGNSTH